MTILVNQKIFSSSTLKPVACELLLRSHNGFELKKFLNNPNMFIEELVSLTEGKALAILALMRLNPSMVYFINYTPSQMVSEEFIDALNIFIKAGIPPSSIGIEITEVNPIDDWGLLKNQLVLARKKGFHIIVDDFSQGHSNLRSLIEIQPSVVKLDLSIIQGAEICKRRKTLLNSIVRLVHEMGAKVIIEGIETAAQLSLANQSGADMLQGYFMSMPEQIA